jgi:hypothetical protein
MINQALLIETEKAVKAVIDNLNIGSAWPCKTSFGNTFDETQNQILVESEGNTDEAAPGLGAHGVHKITMKVAVYEAAPDGNTSSTASNVVFNGLCKTSLATELMVSSSNKIFVYNRRDYYPLFSNAEVGDSWQQVVTFPIDCCLTTGST